MWRGHSEALESLRYCSTMPVAGSGMPGMRSRGSPSRRVTSGLDVSIGGPGGPTRGHSTMRRQPIRAARRCPATDTRPALVVPQIWCGPRAVFLVGLTERLGGRVTAGNSPARAGESPVLLARSHLTCPYVNQFVGPPPSLCTDEA